MSLSAVLFLFLAHLGVGIAFTLVFVARGAGVKFFRFNAGLAAVLMAIALAFRHGALGSVVPATSPFDRYALLALDVAEGALVFYWATLGRLLPRIRPAILGAAVVSGLAAIVLQALAVSANQPPAVPVLTLASFVTSAA